MKLTGEDLYSLAILLQNVDRRTIVLVEGETDSAALDPHLSAEDCQSLIGKGKKAVIRAVEIAQQCANGGVIGVVDRDFTGLLESEQAPPGLFLTDEYDLDSTILSFNDIVERVVSGHCAKKSMDDHRASGGSDYLTPALESCRMIAALRAYCKQSGLRCNLRDLPMHAILHRSTGEVETGTLVKIVQSRCSDKPPPSHEQIMSGISTGLAMIRNGSSSCSGHDLLSALAFFMHNRWKSAPISGPTLGHTVRASFDCNHLQRTNLYSEVREWSARSGRRVWRCPDIPKPRTPEPIEYPGQGFDDSCSRAKSTSRRSAESL